MRKGDELGVFNGSGSEWLAKITSIDSDGVEISVGDELDRRTEPKTQVTVYQALVPSERIEFVVQKCTELGVFEVVPVVTERVQAKDANPGKTKIERWRRIAVEAAEQSGRKKVPKISEPVEFSQAIESASANGPLLFLWEEEHGKKLREAVRESLSSDSKDISVLIGPVGGLSASEADAARSARAIIAGAGPRILRAETAPVVALTALMYEAGELA